MRGPQFSSAGPMRFRRFARVYAAPLTLTALFCVMLGVAALTSAPVRQQAAAAATPEVRAGGGPLRTLCPACGLGYRCEGSSGKCILDQSTPLPCVAGSKFDEKQGFCVPTKTARPTPYPAGTLQPSSTPRFTPSLRTPSFPTPFETFGPAPTPASTPRPPSTPSTG